MLALFVCILASCGTTAKGDEKIKILCTVFPIYDWARNITAGSESVEVSLLVENGTDLHSFQPSFGDMAKIKDSDIVIYIGGESDKWVTKSIDERAIALELSSLDEIVLYNVSDDRFASAHTHEDGEECHEAHDHTFDEHIWLSLRNAIASCRHLADLLCKEDSDNAKLYSDNAEAYISKLSELDLQMSLVSDKISSPVIFADRFPFVYLLEDYGIDYFAAFAGCTTDTGADFDTVITLSCKLDKYQSKYIFVTERPIDGLADSIIAQTQARTAAVCSLNSMQSIGKTDISSGISYISVMQENINTLAAA